MLSVKLLFEGWGRNAVRGETEFWRALSVQGEQCAVVVMLVLFWNCCFCSIRAQPSCPQLPTSGTEQVGVLTSLCTLPAPPAAPRAWPWSCLLFCLISLYLYL